MKFKVEDIHYVTKLKTDSTRPEKLEIVVHSKMLRDCVQTGKKKVKRKCVWLNEDLDFNKIKIGLSRKESGEKGPGRLHVDNRWVCHN